MTTFTVAQIQAAALLSTLSPSDREALGAAFIRSETKRLVSAYANESKRKRVAEPEKAPKAKADTPAKPAKTIGGKRKRASAEEVARRKSLYLETAAKAFKGEWFGLSKLSELLSEEADGRILRLLFDDGKLSKRGDRRNTEYQVKG
jgi:hypothetical protein